MSDTACHRCKATEGTFHPTVYGDTCADCMPAIIDEQAAALASAQTAAASNKLADALAFAVDGLDEIATEAIARKQPLILQAALDAQQCAILALDEYRARLTNVGDDAVPIHRRGVEAGGPIRPLAHEVKALVESGLSAVDLFRQAADRSLAAVSALARKAESEPGDLAIAALFSLTGHPDPNVRNLARAEFEEVRARAANEDDDAARAPAASDAAERPEAAVGSCAGDRDGAS